MVVYTGSGGLADVVRSSSSSSSESSKECKNDINTAKAKDEHGDSEDIGTEERDGAGNSVGMLLDHHLVRLRHVSLSSAHVPRTKPLCEQIAHELFLYHNYQKAKTRQVLRAQNNRR